MYINSIEEYKTYALKLKNIPPKIPALKWLVLNF